MTVSHQILTFVLCEKAEGNPRGTILHHLRAELGFTARPFFKILSAYYELRLPVGATDIVVEVVSADGHVVVRAPRLVELASPTSLRAGSVELDLLFPEPGIYTARMTAGAAITERPLCVWTEETRSLLSELTK